MSKGIDVNKTNGLSEYFLEISFRFWPKECGVCHDLMQKSEI